MGKDQDLLDAARCGNISVVEKFLNQRAKKSGPLANLRRGPGPNVQDSSGYTPLHHAALNGHLDIVNLLLDHEGLSNIVDNKGCTPLHLASWSGNTDIVKLLLTHSSSVPSVNHMNFDHESALHSASQYGHTEIVKLLIQSNCYPSVRNIRNESPLDLASKYGRLDTVKCLLALHPESLNDFVRCHSPLHLASKNGHKTVVKILLDSGFDVNFMTDVGTALHEAAMYGKIDVVKLLLDYGVDVTLENSRNRTVFDILQDLNTTIACQIEEIIRDHVTLIKLDSDSNDSVTDILPPYDFVTSSTVDSYSEKCSLSDISPPHQFCTPSSDENYYEIPPPPKLMNWPMTGACDNLSSLPLCPESNFGEAPYIYSSATHDADVPLENNSFQELKSDNILYEVPPPMIFSGRQFVETSPQDSVYQNVPFGNPAEFKDEMFDSYVLTSVQDSYIPMMPSANSRLQAPVKPPRKSISPNATNHQKDQTSFKTKSNCYEFLYLASTGGGQQSLTRSTDKSKLNGLKTLSYPNSQCHSDYVDMSSQNSTYENHEVICANGLNVDNNEVDIPFDSMFSEVLPVSMRYENVHTKLNNFNNFMPSKSTPALHASRHTLDQVIPFSSNEKEVHSLKPHHINLRPKRASIQIPTSPTNYQQPPTPDIPPPSPSTAETGIHEKIRPINQEYHRQKSISRDIDTLTDEQLVATIGPSGEIQLILATDNKSVSTDNCETSSDNPFEGLCKGSVFRIETQLSSPAVNKSEYQVHLNASKNIYENVQVIMEGGKRKLVLCDPDLGKNNNQNNSSAMSPFDEKAEWAEIADIMATFGGVISRDSVLSQNVEPNFLQNLTQDPVPLDQCKFESIEHWLEMLGLSQYENLLVINGFDDIWFLGGNIIDDQDLEEIGIENSDHRQKLIIAAQRLPAVNTLSKSRNEAFPKSVDEWLHSINLQEYSENFSNNNITDMERATKLWEVELNTVLKITKIGHRKRILASLGDKHFEHFHNSAELDLTKLNIDLEQLGIDDTPVNENCTDVHPADDAFNGTQGNNLQIRSPIQLMGDSKSSNGNETGVEAQWRHCSNDLISSCCNYIAKYLGSTLVKELKGMESTKNSIQKFKSSSQNLGKIPNIILSISYTGVKFIDAETQQLVCEHEIRNIHCACQDADDLSHFAYITKDHQTHNHYCHVFSSNSVDLASEIILTLGQAFEVAYQIAVKEKSCKASRSSKQEDAKKDLSLS